MGQCRDDPGKGRQPVAGGVPPRHRRADQGRGGSVLHCAGARPHRRGGAWHDACLASPLQRDSRRRLRVGCCRLLRRYGFAVAPEQTIGFMQAVTLLGRARWTTSARPRLPRWRRRPTAATNSRRLFRSLVLRRRDARGRSGEERRGDPRQGRRRRDARKQALPRQERAAANCPRPPNSSRTRDFQQRRRRSGRLPPQAALPALPAAPLVPHRRARTRAASSICAVRCAQSSAPTATCRSPLLRRRQTVPAQAAAADRHLRLDEAAHRRLSETGARGRARRGPRRGVHLRHAADPHHAGAAHPRPRPGAGARGRHRSTTGTAAPASARRCSPSSRCRASPPSRAARRSSSCPTGWNAAAMPRWKRRSAG